MEILSVQNLCKVYGGKNPFSAVKNVSFSLREGEILGLLGPNGSGKTSIIQMLLGTLAKTSGTIRYFNQCFETHRSVILKKIAFASSYNSLPWLLTIAENLEVLGYLYGYKPVESRKRFEPLLERFGIFNKATSLVSSLSAGQITRLMLVKAFFIDPQVALLDEPTASLDPEMSNEICQFILEQKKERNLSMIFTSHKMDEILFLCDRVIFLKEGEIVANDAPRRILQSLSHSCLKLTINEGTERTAALAQKNQFTYKVEQNTVEILIEEGKIAPFLDSLSQAGIKYQSIKINDPSFRDYFFKMRAG